MESTGKKDLGKICLLKFEENFSSELLESGQSVTVQHCDESLVHLTDSLDEKRCLLGKDINQ